MSMSARDPSAVDGQRGTGDIPAGRSAKENDTAGDAFGRDETAGRLPARQIALYGVLARDAFAIDERFMPSLVDTDAFHRHPWPAG